jgi:hypothetical protein
LRGGELPSLSGDGLGACAGIDVCEAIVLVGPTLSDLWVCCRRLSSRSKPGSAPMEAAFLRGN